MDADQTLAVFARKGALLRGHFLLSSGAHSDAYLQCALVLADPREAAPLAAALAARCRELGPIDLVVGPALGGIVIAYELARQLGAVGLFAERDAEQRLALRRGFAVAPGQRVLVAEDVVTTGGSSRELIALLEAAGATVVGVASLIQRQPASPFGARPLVSLATVCPPLWAPGDCPLCAAGSTPVKPGSRGRP